MADGFQRCHLLAMIFRQLFDPETSTYSYLVADEATREAALIDSVREQIERDITLIRELELTLRYALETHCHADHVTASGRLRERLGASIAVGSAAGIRNADRMLNDGDSLVIGSIRLEVRQTPGHTDGCVTFVLPDEGMAFTGDTLLVRGCGRTDFQQGDARALYRSVHQKILSLPESTLLYPGHDYAGRTVSTVAEEKRHNRRLGGGRGEEEFVGIMSSLDLAYPRRMDESVPANLESGLADLPSAEHPVADVMDELGRQDAETWYGMGI